MRPLVALCAFLVLTLLSVVSLPWIALAIGYGILEGNEKYDAMMERSPVIRAWDWWDKR